MSEDLKAPRAVPRRWQQVRQWKDGKLLLTLMQSRTGRYMVEVDDGDDGWACAEGSTPKAAEKAAREEYADET